MLKKVNDAPFQIPYQSKYAYDLIQSETKYSFMVDGTRRSADDYLPTTISRETLHRVVQTMDGRSAWKLIGVAANQMVKRLRQRL